MLHNFFWICQSIGIIVFRFRFCSVLTLMFQIIAVFIIIPSSLPSPVHSIIIIEEGGVHSLLCTRSLLFIDYLPFTNEKRKKVCPPLGHVFTTHTERAAGGSESCYNLAAALFIFGLEIHHRRAACDGKVARRWSLILLYWSLYWSSIVCICFD